MFSAYSAKSNIIMQKKTEIFCLKVSAFLTLTILLVNEYKTGIKA